MTVRARPRSPPAPARRPQRLARHRRGAAASARGAARATIGATPTRRRCCGGTRGWSTACCATLWRRSRACRADCALVAVGGYGRGELFPYSDVDLLILLPDALDDAARDAALEQLIGLLWDIGLEIGHSVRTVDECVDEAAKDITVQTTCSRRGCSPAAARCSRSFAARDRASARPARVLQGQAARAGAAPRRFHDTAYNLEPNLKESPGGLRDLQTILWIARAAGLGTRLARPGARAA